MKRTGAGGGGGALPFIATMALLFIVTLALAFTVNMLREMFFL